MPGTFCYLGVDRSSGRLLRPLGNNSLILGKRYTFSFSQSKQLSLTQLPHKNEDLLYESATLSDPIVGSSIEDYLLSIAPSTLTIPRNVVDGTDCPSVYLLKCMPSDIRRYTNDFGKSRIDIDTEIMENGYDLPYTAVTVPVLDDTKSVVVVFSRSRPFNPNVCYLLVVGLIQPKVCC